VNDQTFGLPIFGQTYPDAPGFAHDSVTSRSAAEAIAPELQTLQRKVLETIACRGPMNADLCALILKRDKSVIRPRFTELSGAKDKLFLLEETGEVRPSALSKPQGVYRLTERGREYLRNLRHGPNGSPDSESAQTTTAPKVS
jgi:hypothetical protein